MFPVRRYLNSIYFEILEQTSSPEVIDIIHKRFGTDGMIPFLMQEIHVLHTKIEEYRPLHIFARLLQKPVYYLKRLLGK